MDDFPLVSKTGKRYRINEDGNHEYESGVIMTPEGAFAPGTAALGRIETSEQGRAMQERRQELARAAALEGLARASKQALDYNGSTPIDAWGFLIEKQAELAIAIDTGRASTEAAKMVGRATGILDRPAGGAQEGATVRISLSGEALSQVLLQLAAERGRRGGVLLPEATGGG